MTASVDLHHDAEKIKGILLSTTNKMQCYTTVTVSVVELELNHANGSSKQAWHIAYAVCTVLELLMMGGETI